MRTDQQKKGALHLYLFDYQQVKGEGFIKETFYSCTGYCGTRVIPQRYS